MHPYFQPIDIGHELPTRIYGGMLAVWALRPALQKSFPLHKNRRIDYLRFLAWCTAAGRRECRLLTEIDEWNRELQRRISLPKNHGDKWEGTFTAGMYLAGLHRAKYWDAQIQANPKLRHRTARWFFREGRQVLGLDKQIPWQIAELRRQFSTFDEFLRYLKLPDDSAEAEGFIRHNCEDICAAWNNEAPNSTDEPFSPLAPPSRMHRFLAEWLPVRANRFLSLARQQNPQAGTDEVTTVARKLNPSTWPLTSQKAITKPFGVNLYGYAKGELGIGEDVRMLALACEAANIPFCVINIELGKDVSQKDSSVEGWMSDSPMFGINIFCMTGIEMCRYICERGSKVLTGHYNIGLWPWELPEWPEAWHHAWSLVDELWGVSHYSAKAYAKAPVPVIPMPLPVVANRIAGTDRRHWGLPESAYLFVFSFDMNSRLTRKNPQGVVKAFKDAAKGKTEQEAGLVLKISHLKREGQQWKKLEAAIGKDPRIHLITSELRRPEVLSLYQNCDCYVSLHRSEGFGRSLAEAQLLGLPLIATGYSGNMEFCKPPTHLVDYTLVSLTKGDYFYGEGQHWAEPDLNQAAGIMRDCLANSDRRPVLYDTEAFSLIYCGKTFKKRLQEISQPEENHGAFCK